jgi:hypothetical protein
MLQQSFLRVAAVCLLTIAPWFSADIGTFAAKEASKALDYRALTAAIIRKLESRIVLPDPQLPLSSYERYYTLVFLDDGSPYIQGRYIATRPGHGNWKVVPPEDMPNEWTDGDCGQLSLGAFWQTMEIDQPLCNFG